MAALTTLANVKGWIPVTDAADDALLTRLIDAMSTWFISQTDRDIASKAYTETFDGTDPRVRVKTYLSSFGGTAGYFESGEYGYSIALHNYPVISLPTPTGGVIIDGVDIPQATNLNQATQTDGWVLKDERRIELVGFRFTQGVANCVINYQAGWATVPADIEQAVIEMVTLTYRRRGRVGQVSRSAGGEAVSFLPDAAPETVTSVVDKYKRINV